MALLSRFFGRTVSEGAAYAFGVATGPVLAPATETIRQEAWNVYQSRIPGVAALAAGVAQGQIKDAPAREWAHKQGFGDEAFDALVNVANTGPDVGMAMQAWRRGELSPDEFRTVLRRHAIETQWDAAIEALKQELLDPAEIAKAIHRGIMKADGLLIASPPTDPGKVPSVPPSDLDPITEAEGSGIDSERLRILVGNAGLPLGLHEMLSLMNRGEMEASDVQRGIAESNLRNEYQDVALKLARQLLTAHDYVEAEIRGYIDRPTRLAGTRMHGMTDADSDLLFLNSGRPLVAHQITTGLARGGKFQPLPGELTDPYDAAVHESNVHPSYYDLWKANRYTYTVPFWWRSMLTADALKPAEAEDLLLRLGNPPDFAKAVTDHFAAPSTASATENPWKSKADTQLWTAIHMQYVKYNSGRTAVEPMLEHIIPEQGVRDAVFTDWELERQVKALPVLPG